MGKDLLLVTLLLSVVIYILDGTYYYSDIFAGSLFISAITCYYFFKNTRLIYATMTISYLLLNSVYRIFEHPSSYYLNYGFQGENFFKFLISQSMLMVLISFFFIINLSKDSLERWGKSLALLCYTSSFLTLLNFIFGSPTGIYGGIMRNVSMDPTLIAILYPLTIFATINMKDNNYKLIKLLLLIIPLLAIFSSKGSVGIGTLAVALSGLFIFRKGELKNYLIGLFLIISVLVLGYITTGEQLFSDSNRFWWYRAAFDWWMIKENIFFGSGLGTYWALGPMSQSVFIDRPAHIIFATWMHSDWLQIIFELGIVGFSLIVLTVFQLLRNSYKSNNRFIFATILAYSSAMIFNMPLHWFWSAFSGVIIFRLGLEDERLF